MSNSKYLCVQYGSKKCPMYGTCGMIYDICPLCEKHESSNAENDFKEPTPRIDPRF